MQGKEQAIMGKFGPPVCGDKRPEDCGYPKVELETKPDGTLRCSIMPDPYVEYTSTGFQEVCEAVAVAVRMLLTSYSMNTDQLEWYHPHTWASEHVIMKRVEEWVGQFTESVVPKLGAKCCTLAKGVDWLWLSRINNLRRILAGEDPHACCEESEVTR